MELQLTDGAVFSGRSVGAERQAAGEVVFHTGMAGYVETLTDPSYRGQILVMSFPSIGNYGVSPRLAESAGIQVEGLVLAHAAEGTGAEGLATLAGWLRAEGVPAVDGVDTRALIGHLRVHGPLHGQLRGRGEAALSPAAGRLAEHAAWPTRRIYPGGRLRVLVIDMGARESLVRSLCQRGATVVRSPFWLPWEELLPEVDAVVLSSGPGDPASLGDMTARVRRLLDMELPLLGLCLGHQILALAAGAETYRLPAGHRSHNQPVYDQLTRRAYMTSQNHGYAVRTETLPEAWVPRFVNLEDGTNEGMSHRDRPFWGVQFHPEAAAGPHDTSFLFDQFLRLAGGAPEAAR